jgi:hypothetical protein
MKKRRKRKRRKRKRRKRRKTLHAALHPHHDDENGPKSRCLGYL